MSRRVIVLVTKSPGKYLVGETSRDLNQITEGLSKIEVHNPVRMTVAENPDEPGQQRAHLNPIMVCQTMWVDLDHYIGVGYLKDDLLSKYNSWKSSYKDHEEFFNEKE